MDRTRPISRTPPTTRPTTVRLTESPGQAAEGRARAGTAVRGRTPVSSWCVPRSMADQPVRRRGDVRLGTDRTTGCVRSGPLPHQAPACRFCVHSPVSGTLGGQLLFRPLRWAAPQRVVHRWNHTPCPPSSPSTRAGSVVRRMVSRPLSGMICRTVMMMSPRGFCPSDIRGVDGGGTCTDQACAEELMGPQAFAAAQLFQFRDHGKAADAGSAEGGGPDVPRAGVPVLLRQTRPGRRPGCRSAMWPPVPASDAAGTVPGVPNRPCGIARTVRVMSLVVV